MLEELTQQPQKTLTIINHPKLKDLNTQTEIFVEESYIDDLERLSQSKIIIKECDKNEIKYIIDYSSIEFIIHRLEDSRFRKSLLQLQNNVMLSIHETT